MGSIYANTLLNMGICFQNVGDYDQAVQIYTKFITLNPN